MKKTITLLFGNNIDKGLIDSIRTKIEKDKDIKRLFRIGKSALYFQYILAVIFLALAVISFIGRFGEITLPWGNKLYRDTPLATVLAFAFLIITVIITILGACDDLSSIRDYCMTIVGYFRYIFNIHSKLPGSPLEIWRAIQGSVADIQMLNTCRNLEKENQIDAVYSGAPYYDTIYIDDITIRWGNTAKNWFGSTFQLIREKIAYCSYRKEYAKRLMMARADDSYFIKGKNQLAYSNSVFGILFSSGYFSTGLKLIKITG